MPDETPDETSDEPTAPDDATETDATAPGADATELDETTEPQAAVDDASDDAVDEPVAATNGDHRPGVFIPRGVAILLGVLLLIGIVGGGGFALGRSTADDDGDREHRALPFGAGGGNGSQGQNNGNGNGGNGNGGAPGNNVPQLPFDSQPTPVAGAFLGVRIDDATGDTSGAQVLLVASGSPAAEAGLESGDVITQVDGDEILGADDLVNVIADHDPGDTVTITFLRDGDGDGDTETVEVELADPSSARSSTSPAQPSPAN